MTYPPNAPPPSGGYGGPPAGSGESKAPMIMGIIGIVTWFCCPVAAIVLGLLGQQQAKKNGQSPTLPLIAFIGGIVFLILNIVYFVAFR